MVKRLFENSMKKFFSNISFQFNAKKLLILFVKVALTFSHFLFLFQQNHQKLLDLFLEPLTEKVITQLENSVVYFLLSFILFYRLKSDVW